MLCGFFSRLPASSRISSKVAENSRLLLCGQQRQHLFTSWMKPMSSMRSASSSTRISTVDRSMKPCCCRSSRRPGRGDQDVHAALHAVDLRVHAHAAEDHGGLECQVLCRRCAPILRPVRPVRAWGSAPGRGCHGRQTCWLRPRCGQAMQHGQVKARSCRCRSVRRPANHGLPGRREWPGPGWGGVVVTCSCTACKMAGASFSSSNVIILGCAHPGRWYRPVAGATGGSPTSSGRPMISWRGEPENGFSVVPSFRADGGATGTLAAGAIVACADNLPGFAPAFSAPPYFAHFLKRIHGPIRFSMNRVTKTVPPSGRS